VPQVLQSSAKKADYKIWSNLRQLLWRSSGTLKTREQSPISRKFGKPIKTRKFGYDVTVRTSVRTDSKGGGMESQGNPNGAVQECHVFLAGFLRKRKLISICYVNK